MINWRTLFELKGTRSQEEIEKLLEERFPASAELTSSSFVKGLREKLVELRGELKPLLAENEMEREPLLVSSSSFDNYMHSSHSRETFLVLVPGREPDLYSFDSIGRAYSEEFVTRHELTHEAVRFYGICVDGMLEEGICDLRAYFAICGTDQDLYDMVEEEAEKKEPFSFKKTELGEKTRLRVESVDERIGDLAKSVAVVVMGSEYEKPSPQTVVPTKREVSLALGSKARRYIEEGRGDIYSFAEGLKRVSPRKTRTYSDIDGETIKI